jgi:hypothetical protein
VTLQDCIQLDEAIIKAEGLMTFDEYYATLPPNDSYEAFEEASQCWEIAQERKFANWLAFPGDRVGACC